MGEEAIHALRRQIERFEVWGVPKTLEEQHGLGSMSTETPDVGCCMDERPRTLDDVPTAEANLGGHTTSSTARSRVSTHRLRQELAERDSVHSEALQALSAKMALLEVQLENQAAQHGEPHVHRARTPRLDTIECRSNQSP